MEYVCKCGGKSFYTQDKGPHKGMYCLHCNKWLTWINKATEVELKKQGIIKSKAVSYTEEAEQVVPKIHDGAAIDTSVIQNYNRVNVNDMGLDVKTPESETFEEEDWNVVSKGCELCENDKLKGTYCGGNMQLLKGSLIIHKPDGTINYQFGSTVKYCPHCGRKIED